MHRNVAWHFQDACSDGKFRVRQYRYVIQYDLEWNPASMEQRAIPLEDLTDRLLVSGCLG